MARIAAWASPVLAVLGIVVTVVIALVMPDGVLTETALPTVLALGAFEGVFLSGAGAGLVGALSKTPSKIERVIAGLSGAFCALAAVAGCGLTLFVWAYVVWAVNALFDAAGV